MIIGIDLGTTNSLVAAWDGEHARILPNALGNLLTPSVVGLDDHGQLVVGDIARERLHTHPHLTTSLFKRYMGSSRETLLGARAYRAEELSAMLLRSLNKKGDRSIFCKKQKKGTTKKGDRSIFRIINSSPFLRVRFGAIPDC